MIIAADLERIALQEEIFVFEQFDASTAWELGGRIKAVAEKRGVSVAFDVTLNGATVFYHGMPGTTLDHADWIRRKRNVAHRFQRPSYVVALWLERDKTTLAESHGASATDYAPHGGAFPIRVRGVGVVGTVTVSGVPQRDDHGIVVEALAEMFGKEPSGLALE
ncbi:MAG: heme-degrading domain-containing protein [Nibricoccus sp.]